jgi:hypothetical protein
MFIDLILKLFDITAFIDLLDNLSTERCQLGIAHKNIIHNLIIGCFKNLNFASEFSYKRVQKHFLNGLGKFSQGFEVYTSVQLLSRLEFHFRDNKTYFPRL